MASGLPPHPPRPDDTLAQRSTQLLERANLALKAAGLNTTESESGALHPPPIQYNPLSHHQQHQQPGGFEAAYHPSAVHPFDSGYAVSLSRSGSGIRKGLAERDINHSGPPRDNSCHDGGSGTTPISSSVGRRDAATETEELPRRFVGVQTDDPPATNRSNSSKRGGSGPPAAAHDSEPPISSYRTASTSTTVNGSDGGIPTRCASTTAEVDCRPRGVQCCPTTRSTGDASTMEFGPGSPTISLEEHEAALAACQRQFQLRLVESEEKYATLQNDTDIQAQRYDELVAAHRVLQEAFRQLTHLDVKGAAAMDTFEA